MMTTLMAIGLAAQFATHDCRITYEGGLEYRVRIVDGYVTWTGLKGPDEGREETDAVTVRDLSPTVDVLSWTERDGTFVTIALDYAAGKVVSTGIYAGQSWSRAGRAQCRVPKLL